MKSPLEKGETGGCLCHQTIHAVRVHSWLNSRKNFRNLTMENVWAIITKPDNIPIVGLIILLFFFTFITFKQGFENDKRIERKRHQKGE